MSSFIAIASQTLSSPTSSVTFNSIPTSLNGKTLRDLVIIARFTLGNGLGNVFLRFNNDTSSTYHHLWMAGDGSSTQSVANTNNTAQLGNMVVSGQFICQVFDYQQAIEKTVLTRMDDAANRTQAIANRWPSTSAITSLGLTVGVNNFTSGSVFSLYGIEG